MQPSPFQDEQPSPRMLDHSSPTVVAIRKVSLISPGRFFYLATPYAKYPHGVGNAAADAAIVAGELMEADVNVFSPIAHGHMLRAWAGMTPKPHAWWMNVDRAYMDAALGLIVAQLPDWDNSKGVHEEMEYFARHRKPVFRLSIEMNGNSVSRIS